MSQIHPLSFFRPLVWVDGQTPLLDTIEPYRQDIFTHTLYTFRPDGTILYKRVLTGRTKKTFKTSDAMLSGIYKLFVWKPAGSKGNQIYIVASDLAQANDDLELTKKFIRSNPILNDLVILKNNIIELKDGTGFIEILPARDAQSLHGKTYLFLVVDELHTQKDYKLLEALELDRTRPDAMQWFASYASMYRHKGVPLVDIQRQHEAGTDPRLYVSWYAGTIEEACPSLNTPYGPTMEDIEDAKRSLPSWIFRRLYLNLPGQPDDAAFDAERVEEAVVANRKVLPPVPGVTYTAFCDLSGGGGDDATLAIAHENNTGIAVLDLLIDQGARTNGTFSPDATVEKFSYTLKVYGCTSVVGDRYAAQWPIQAFQKHGIDYRPAELDRSQLYASFEPLLNSGRVELLDHPKLVQQFIGLIRKGEKIDHASGGDHDDHANAAAGVSVLVVQANQHSVQMYNIMTGRPFTERELWQRGLIG